MDRAIPMAAKRTGDRSDEGVAERTKRRPATRRFIFAVSLRSLTSAISQRRRAGCIINKAWKFRRGIYKLDLKHIYTNRIHTRC